jgi:hypothetical protein
LLKNFNSQRGIKTDFLIFAGCAEKCSQQSGHSDEQEAFANSEDDFNEDPAAARTDFANDFHRRMMGLYAQMTAELQSKSVGSSAKDHDEQFTKSMRALHEIFKQKGSKFGITFSDISPTADLKKISFDELKQYADDDQVQAFKQAQKGYIQTRQAAFGQQERPRGKPKNNPISPGDAR